METTPPFGPPPAPTASSATAVRITGVDIGFGDLVVLLIKVTLAYIPAMIILMIIFGIIGAVFGGIFAGLTGAF